MCGVPVFNYFFQNRKIASNRYKIVLLYSSTHRSTIHFPVHSTQRWQNLVCIQTGSYQMNMMSVIVIIINYKYYYGMLRGHQRRRVCNSVYSHFISIISNISAKVSFYKDKKRQKAIVVPYLDAIMIVDFPKSM